VLGGTRSPELREWLLARVATRSGVLRRVRLAPKTPERLAALQALASGVWAADEGAAAVLDLARRSPDPDIRAAATPRRAKRATPRAAAYAPPAPASTDA